MEINISRLNDTGLYSQQNESSIWVPGKDLKTTLCILYVIVCTVGVTGNMLVCYILGFKAKCKRHFDVLLISLAVVDLMALVSGSMTMIGDLTGDLQRWHFGAAMCKLLPSISPITLFASSWTLAVISYDRYRVIRQKCSKEIKKRFIACQLVFVWIAAIIVTVPYIAGSKYESGTCYTKAIWRSDLWVGYVGFWITTGWGIPLIVITCFCYMILQKLNKAVRQGTNSNIQRRSIKRNRDILKLFIIMVCTFFILTTPYSAFYFSATYFTYMQPKNVSIKVAQQLNYALFVLMMINSSINPILYAKLHKGINRSAVRFWRRLRRVSNYKCGYHLKHSPEAVSISRGHGSSASGDLPL